MRGSETKRIKQYKLKHVHIFLGRNQKQKKFKIFTNCKTYLNKTFFLRDSGNSYTYFCFTPNMLIICSFTQFIANLKSIRTKEI